MIAPRKSGDISGPALLHLAVLIAFALLLVAAMTSRSEEVATEHFDGTISVHERATSDAAAQARLLAETYFGVDRLIDHRSHDPIMDDSLFMAMRWAEFGLRSEVAIYPGGVHAFDYFETAQAQQSHDRIAEFIESVL